MSGKNVQLCSFTGLFCAFWFIPHTCSYFLEQVVADVLRIVQKQVRLCKYGTIMLFHGLNKVIWLITMKMRLNMKNKAHGYDMS